MGFLSSNHDLGFAGINFNALPCQVILPSIQFLDQLSFAVGDQHLHIAAPKAIHSGTP